MRLYSGFTDQFVSDAIQHTIAEKLSNVFDTYFGHPPSVSELNSWRNSLSALAMQVMYANLRHNGLILEMQLPLTSRRLDCLITGRDEKSADRAVILELKQWSKVEETDVDDCVVTFIGGRERTVLHPSAQVSRYEQYLQDTSTAFQGDGAIALSSCSYLHNFQYDPISLIYDNRFSELLRDHPIFAGNQADELARYLTARLSKGDDGPILQRVLDSRYRASKKLLEHTAEIIRGEPVFTLLDDQVVVFNTILAHAKKGYGQARKCIVLVKGGPGTGKSLIALNVLARLSQDGFNVQHATGSRAFTENIRHIVGSRASAQFLYFNSYVSAQLNDIDVLIMDEAHRIRKTSNNRFTPKTKKSELLQIEELVSAAKVSVFFIDDVQVVRPDEVGSSSLIRETASRLNATLIEEELTTQFRCAGSDGFIQWVENTLGIKETPHPYLERDDVFDFQVFDSPQELESAIRAKMSPIQNGRIAAGFCWPWSDPRPDGTLIDDVVIGNYRRPWNARPDAGRLARGIPRAQLWASDPNGFDQIGCVYTAQGFEFDYIGVIFGADMMHNALTGNWEGHREYSKDSAVTRRAKESFLEYVRNTYRVLLTRGMKGCYVYFVDPGTRSFFESRMER